MPRYLILAQSKITADALNAWREMLGLSENDDAISCPAAILHAPQMHSLEAGTLGYAMLVQRIERFAKADAAALPLNDVVVMVDSIHPMQMSAVTENASWDNLIALLILTFPEIKWVFGVICGDRSRSDGKFPETDHCLASLLSKPRRDPLFDPTGLREWVRICTNDKLSDLRKNVKAKPLTLARREQMAAAIDEEVDYALMHAHAAYHYGYRADVVTTWSLMKARFGQKDQEIRRSHGYKLLLEDMRLFFPDRPVHIHLSDLGKHRAIECPLLDVEHDDSSWRFLITTGQESEDNELVRTNEGYLEGKRKRYLDGKGPLGRGGIHFKPVGTMTDLWHKTGLYDEPHGDRRAGNADGFEWPPKGDRTVRYDGHAAPGKLAMVAATLIRRAADLQKVAQSSAEYLQCALLATDSAEYLGGKTPTLTLAAITIKHECEVRAECAFVGAGHHSSPKRRIDELRREIQCVSQWYGEEKREQTEWDAMASVLNRLVLAYRDAGQFDEEHHCLVAFRKTNRQLSRPHGKDSLKLFAWAKHGLLAYCEFLMVSLDKIVGAVLFWWFVITLVALLIDSSPVVEAVCAVLGYECFEKLESSLRPLASVASSTAGWMFGGNTAEPGAPVLRHLLSWFAVGTGVLHVGILISFLYSLIARK